MKKILLTALALLVALPAVSVKVATGLGGANSPLRYAYKSTFERAQLNSEKKAAVLTDAKGRAQAIDLNPVAQHGKTTDFGYLNGPDGTDWFYTANHEIEKVPVPGGYEGLTTDVIKAYEFSIYNSNHELVGTIRDKIELDEANYETGVADVSLSACVTKKFFNYDNNYEVMVCVVYNIDLSQGSYPNVHTRTYVYGIGGQKDGDYDVKLATIPGYLIDSVNAAPDRWAESFYLTFIEPTGDTSKETQDEFLASCGYNTTIYSKVGYGDSSPKVVSEFFVPDQKLPGDQMSSPFFFSFLRDGQPYFATALYENKFYSTQGVIDWETGEISDPVQNEENNLVITINKVVSGALSPIQVTKIPVVKDESVDGAIFTYYGLGHLRYEKDIDYGNYLFDPDQAALTIAKMVYTTASDDTYVTSFNVYDNLGEPLLPLANNCNGYVNMSDIPGEEPQVLFIYFDGTNYTLSYVDLFTGEEAFHTAQQINGVSINTNVDRVATPEGTLYAISAAYADYDEQGNTIHKVLWLNDDGRLVRTDKLNLGQNVELATLNIDRPVLSPYLFNTDDRIEYMVLVKRRVDGKEQLEEQFSLATVKEGILMTIGPDEEKGSLISIATINNATTPQLNIVYRDTDYNLFADFYDLPFTYFAGGDGSADNPYLISTFGDLQQMKKFTSANYKIINDIDAEGYSLEPLNNFSGTIDGENHVITNITFNGSGSYAGFIGYASDAVVKNLTFVGVEFELTSDQDKVACVAADALNTKFDNIHVYDLEIDDAQYSGMFAPIAAQLTITSSVTNSSAANADIELPNASVGGIACNLFTGVSISNCSFSGSITGGTSVGGIVGTTHTGDEMIDNCHVDAEITAQNTVGGIIGYSRRSTVDRCYVEGSIEATTANRWTDVGPCAGGIVGELEGDFGNSGAGMQYVSDTGVVRNCLVALSSLEGYTSDGPGEFDEQRTTMHRIIGRSKINNQADDDQAMLPEAAIFNNYAVSSLAIVDGNVANDASTTEGESIASPDRTFFESTLGFSFGDDQPWSDYSESDPYLNHERAIFFYPETLNPEIGEKFMAQLMIVSREDLNLDDLVSSFSCSSTDEEVAMPTGVFRLEDNTLLIEFESTKIGTASVTAYLLGSQAVLTVESQPVSVKSVIASPAAISYRAGKVIAENCTIEIYSTTGTLAARGLGELATESLQKGIYLAVAVDANGNRSVLKILVK